MYYSNDIHSNDTRVDDVVTFTVIFILKIAILDFVNARGISVSQTHLVLLNMISGGTLLYQYKQEDPNLHAENNDILKSLGIKSDDSTAPQPEGATASS